MPGNDHGNNELRLEEDGGYLIPLDVRWTPVPSPHAYLGQGVSDPFSQLLSWPDHRMAKHLYYYINVMMPQMHPSYSTNMVRKTFGCKSLISADELVLSAIAAFSATSKALLSGDLVRRDLQLTQHNTGGFHEGVYEWLYFKGMTIKLVNERLGKMEEAVADNTIGGICDLILLETYTGNIADATAHMKGLRSLADLRRTGGALGYRMASKILASDIKLATLTHCQPLLPFTLTPKIALPLPSIDHILPNLGSTLLRKWPTISANSSMISILYDMASMTRHTEAVYEWIFPYAEDDSYFEYINDQNLYIERRLLSYTSAASNVVEECVRVACLLYCNTALVRGYPVSAAIVHNTVVLLKKTLELNGGGSDLGMAWRGNEDVLFWVLFLGCYASAKQHEEVLFLDKLRETVRNLGLTSLEQAKLLLEGYLFVDTMYLDTLRTVWENF